MQLPPKRLVTKIRKTQETSKNQDLKLSQELSDAAKRFLYSIIYVCKSIVFLSFRFSNLLGYWSFNIWKQGYFRNKTIKIS